MGNSYIYILYSVINLIIILGYFQFAKRFNIIDKPNERSMHKKITIRGGGIIFLFSAICFFFVSNFQYAVFFVGLILVSLISFLDDVFTLPNRYRLPFQLIAIICIGMQLDLFSETNIFIAILFLVVGIGTINAYNFMDGINGMTGGYSLSIIISLWLVNNYHNKFIENDFLYFIAIGLIIFNYFNFRNKAVCFAGDVGSISMATILIFLIIKLILKDQNIVYIFFLAIYGIDSIFTIVQRLFIRENIFRAHRLHLFQLIVQKLKISHLKMSSIYWALQLGINIFIIRNLENKLYDQIFSLGFLLICICIAYIIIKFRVINIKHVNG